MHERNLCIGELMHHSIIETIIKIGPATSVLIVTRIHAYKAIYIYIIIAHIYIHIYIYKATYICLVGN